MTTYKISSGTEHHTNEASVVVNRSGSEFAGGAGVAEDGAVYAVGFGGGDMVHPAHAAEQEREVHEAIRATIADGRPRSVSFGAPRRHQA